MYLYLLVTTTVAFAAFGGALGTYEMRLERRNRGLAELALTDELTGLRNLRYFQARLEEELAASARTHRPLALAVIDLDLFKAINDHFGHGVGDAALRLVGAAITSTVRQGETAARVGGEEFAILMPANDAAAARIAGERIRAAIARASSSLPAGGTPLNLSASVGMATTAELPTAGPGQLYQAADEMLYRAKERGRNRVEVAPSGYVCGSQPSTPDEPRG